MRVIAWLISAGNVYFGMRCLLNALGVLQTSKYSQTSNVVAAILFLGLGAGSFYLSIFRGQQGLALLISFAPWVIGFIILFISMVTSRYP